MRTLPLLLVLAACGDPLTKPAIGTCEAPIGTIGLSTGDLTRSDGSAVQWTGEHTLYTGSGILAFPESDIDSSVEVVLCEDPDGCKAPTVDYNDGDLIAIFLDEADNVRLTGWGQYQGGEVAGRCRTAFGDGDFTWARE